MLAWQTLPSRTQFQYAAPVVSSQIHTSLMPFPFEPQSAAAPPPLAPRNEVEMTREMLSQVLTYFSTLIPSQFPRPVRLVVHGGACMLLHPGLYAQTSGATSSSNNSPSGYPFANTTSPSSMPISSRTATRDVDYINRSFAAEWHASNGISDATERLKKCIRATARRFNLGADWMNSDADVALPMATE